YILYSLRCSFFFQAEDGIRDGHVTGVQTCALPILQKILELPGTMPSISCTTRPRRATESSGKCYDFVSEAEFEAMVARGEFFEYARVFGKHSYGTPKKWLEESRKKGLDLVLEIDV